MEPKKTETVWSDAPGVMVRFERPNGGNVTVSILNVEESGKATPALEVVIGSWRWDRVVETMTKAMDAPRSHNEKYACICDQYFCHCGGVK